jgi:hypothetical protein
VPLIAVLAISATPSPVRAQNGSFDGIGTEWVATELDTVYSKEQKETLAHREAVKAIDSLEKVGEQTVARRLRRAEALSYWDRMTRIYESGLKRIREERRKLVPAEAELHRESLDSCERNLDLQAVAARRHVALLRALAELEDPGPESPFTEVP